ncbi:MAG TPA: hypothetical protein VN847_13395 [Streptosporangiaceae bacterium]|nr:hypothetical protein [Streptosporangiaceae bacterium]
MGLRDKLRKSAAAYLQPGEPVQAVFPAQTCGYWKMMMTGLILNRFRIVAVTPQRIVVLDAGKFSAKKAKGFVVELPRSTRLGPGKGMFHVIPAGQEKLHVHRSYFKDLRAADDYETAAA